MKRYITELANAELKRVEKTPIYGAISRRLDRIKNCLQHGQITEHEAAMLIVNCIEDAITEN